MVDQVGFCADRSRELCEPMLGTAPPVDAWLMLEHDALWQAKALKDNALPQDVSDWILRSEQALGARHGVVRTQFIKQRRAGAERVTVMICTGGVLRRRCFEDHESLVSWRVNVDDMEEVVSPQYFVCTNGRRDRCCSKFGLPAYRALREAVGERAWETTHTGGHRFAPNVVALPQEALYGRVLPEEIPEFARSVDAGELYLKCLRGRASLPKVAQVAEPSVNGARQLVSVEEGVVTFDTTSGLKSIEVGAASEALSVVPSCGAEEEQVRPLEVLCAPQ